MLKIVLKLPVLIFCMLALGTCIDPYNPHLSKYKSLLVVDGLVTDEKVPYEVRLSRTFQSNDSISEKISDAKVSISDETGNLTSLNYSGNGIYKTNSALFSGEWGKTYTLHIETDDGNKYESEPCVMAPVPDIDSVYYEKDEEVDNTLGKSQTGLKIYLDSDEAPGGNRYFRWEYEETWKFMLPFIKRYDYINESLIVKLGNLREYCWKSNKSGEILTGSILQGQTNFIKKEPVLFIPSDKSDRLTILYSIIIKQFSVSQKEFDFWNNLKQVNESTGNIFDTQPYSVISNIYNVNNPDEKVLGYFKVSAVKMKRIFINPEDLLGMNLPRFDYYCARLAKAPEDYPSGFGPPLTWDDIYEMFMNAGGFTFVEPIYKGETKELLKLVFTADQCADCGLTGTVVKPDFWP